MKLVTRDAAGAALTAFNGDWEDMIRLQLTEALAAVTERFDGQSQGARCEGGSSVSRPAQMPP
ncbi:MAG: hypothetical protein ACHQ9S_18490 [Candidatus Binatia bacterium]